MDEKDEQILEILMENAKTSTQRISNRLGIPVTTVHNRIKRMEKNGIIDHYAASVDFEKLGKKISAVVLVALDHKAIKETNKDVKELMKKIKAIPGVQRVSMVTGPKDLIIRIRAKDVPDLDRILTSDLWKMESVSQTETLIVTHDI